MFGRIRENFRENGGCPRYATHATIVIGGVVIDDDVASYATWWADDTWCSYCPLEVFYWLAIGETPQRFWPSTLLMPLLDLGIAMDEYERKKIEKKRRSS